MSGDSSNCDRNGYISNPVSISGNQIPNGILPSHPIVPPSSPYSQIPLRQSTHQSFGTIPGHSRSLSQPSGFFSLDSLPPLSPSSFRTTTTTSLSSNSDPLSLDVSMEDRDLAVSSHATSMKQPLSFGMLNSNRASDSLPPRKTHRRSHSEIPFGFNLSMPSPTITPPMLLLGPQAGPLDRSVSAKDGLGSAKQEVLQGQSMKHELEWERGFDVADAFFDAYMNFDGLDALNSPGTEEKHENKGSGTKTNGGDSSENEAESSINESGSSVRPTHHRLSSGNLPGKKEGTKRSASSDLGVSDVTSLHSRSISMDSFTGKMGFGDESLRPPPSPGLHSGKHLSNNSLDGTASTFILEFGNGEFSGAELKKIMANEKLAEMALTDPKRVKRILANRQSAARSKERKMRYISELEHKVQALQTDATTLSTQLTLLQRDFAEFTSQNNELKFRLQAMERQAQLRDALNEALTAEVQHLKVSTAGLSEANSSDNMNQQLTMKFQMFQFQQQQQALQQQPVFQTKKQSQQQLQHQQQHDESKIKNERDE